jgi:hypothetical protein
MKTTLGKLKHLIREAAGEEHVKAYEKTQVGDWYKERPKPRFRGATVGAAEVVQLVDLYWRDFGGEHGKLLMATRRGAGGDTVTSRYDVWMEKFEGPASREEVAQAKEKGEAKLAHMARNIDTSREGT